MKEQLVGPPCVFENTEKFAQPCEDCPFSPEVAQGCGVLALAQSLESSRQETAALKAKIAEKDEIIEELSHDPLIPTSYTRRGVYYGLENDHKEAIIGGNIGMLGADFRGLKYANDKKSPKVGDLLLINFGLRLTLNLRSVEKDKSEERRINLYNIKDLLLRPGGDEVAILVAGAPHDNSERSIQNRLQTIFSPKAAIKNDHKGEIPLIANFGSIHSTNLSQHNYPQPADREKAVKEQLDRAVSETFNLCGVGKERQYAEMHWLNHVGLSKQMPPMPDSPRAIESIMSHHGLPSMPSEKRDIVSDFYQRYLTNFSSASAAELSERLIAANIELLATMDPEKLESLHAENAPNWVLS